MKTEAEIRHEYELTRAKLKEYRQQLGGAIDNLARFRHRSRDDRIAWKNLREIETELSFLAIRCGTLRFVLNIGPGEDEQPPPTSTAPGG